MASEKQETVGNAAACTDCMTIDDAISHAEEVANASDTPCARQHRQLADWLKELRDVKSQPVGNAAAMREALETIHDKVNGLDEECGVDPVEIRDLARAALSAPARNCDVFASDIDAFEYWDNHYPVVPGTNTIQPYNEWLFAPAGKCGAE